MASYFHASPMDYYEYHLAVLAFVFRAQNRYLENFTELQHNLKNSVSKLTIIITFDPIRLLSLCLLL
jgi:hypothetical protein